MKNAVVRLSLVIAGQSYSLSHVCGDWIRAREGSAPAGTEGELRIEVDGRERSVAIRLVDTLAVEQRVRYEKVKA